MDYKDESKHDDISMHTLLKNIHLIITILLQMIPLYLSICTHLNMGSTHGLLIQISQINILYFNLYPTIYSTFQQYQDFTSNFIKSRFIHISK